MSTSDRFAQYMNYLAEGLGHASTATSTIR